jgi:predicted AAA+ superfamily ATPase
MNNITRTLQSRIQERMLPNKAMIIYGARRVGKTTLLRQIIEESKLKSMLLNGEDADSLLILENKSISNYRRIFENIELLAIDEAQNIPSIGEKVKLIVDEIPNIKVLLTGSSSLDLFTKTGEPLVGRSTNFMLYPFSYKEISQNENALLTMQNLEERLIYGSYPDVTLLQSSTMKKEYLSDIVSAYLLKDILNIDGIRNSGKIMQLLRLIAFQMGQEVSYEGLSRELSLSKNTVEKYLDILAKCFVVHRLGSFSRNLRKEVAKAGKWYFFDNGVRNAIIGNFNSLSLRQDIGALWECYIINEIIKKNSNSGIFPDYYFWRTYDQQEIDLIISDINNINAYEIKWSNDNAKCPKVFRDTYPESSFDVITKNNLKVIE